MEDSGAAVVKKKQILERKAIPIMVDGVEIIETIIDDLDTNENYEEIPTDDGYPETEEEPVSPNECPNCRHYAIRKKTREAHKIVCDRLIARFRKLRQNQNTHGCHLCLYACVDVRQLRLHLKRHSPGCKGKVNFIRLSCK